MSKVRTIKDLMLFVCLFSMACPEFGHHNLSPLDITRFDPHSRFDPVTFRDHGHKATPLAMPCLSVGRKTGVPDGRSIDFTEPKFEGIEECSVCEDFQGYEYAKKKPPYLTAPTAVVRVDGGNSLRDLTAYALAR